MPDLIHRRLIAWARWCKSGHIPAEFWVGCTSAESDFVPEAGEVLDSTQQRLQTALERGVRALSDSDAIQVELALLKLPSRARQALRLHYVGYPRMSINQKRRALGVSADNYFRLVEDSAGALAGLLRLDLAKEAA